MEGARVRQSGPRRYVTISAVGIASYFLLPSVAQNLAMLASNLVALGTILLTVHRRALRPRSGWLLLAAFPLATAVGNAVYFVNDNIRHVSPFPSPGDAAFLSGYLLLAAGLLRLQRERSVRRDLPAVLDTAIVTIGFAAFSWVALVGPMLRDSAVPLIERLTALGYPVGDVLVLAVAARFLTSRRRSPASIWLAATVVVMLTADTAMVVLTVLGRYETGHPVDALILAYNLGWGAVALHAGSADLAVPAGTAAARPSRWRLATLTVAGMISPVVLVAQVVIGRTDGAVLTAAASALLFLLVVIRMAGLVRALEQVLEQRSALEHELAHRADHDDLTGLVNRRSFGAALQQALSDRPGGGTDVLYLDLDRFKTVNDTLGHAAGDRLLQATADRLRGALRPQDVVARLGGDEFAVLLEPESGRDLEQVRVVLSQELGRPVVLQGLDLLVAASIGTARAEPGDSAEDVMHRADLAMYADKSRQDRRAVGLAAVAGQVTGGR